MFLCPIKQESPYITQYFGERPSVYNRFGLKGHNGLDFRCKSGTLLSSPIDGVVFTGDEGRDGYGKYIRIKNGEYDVILAHLSKIEIRAGSKVKVGDPLAFSGNTGFSSAPHLHFGVRKLDSSGIIVNKNNGFAGYLDFFPFVVVWAKTLNESISR